MAISETKMYITCPLFTTVQINYSFYPMADPRFSKGPGTAD